MINVSTPWLIACALLIGGLFAGAARAETVTVRIAGVEAFDRWQRDSTVELDTARGTVQLAPVSYVVHDIGNRKGRVGINGDRVARKRFDLDRPGAGGADIYVYQGRGEATINGHSLQFTAMHHGHGGWSEARVAANWLREGENEIVFHRGFNLAFDRDFPEPKFSDVSADGGESWTPAAGEWLVHIRLHGRANEGTVTSPVYDLANPSDANEVAPRITVGKVEVHPVADVPADGALTVEVRSGPSPVPDANWSPWSNAIDRGHRFVQSRMVLSSDRLDATPVVRAVRIEADVTVEQEPVGIRVLSAANPPVVRASQPFTFQPPSPKLTQLREQFNLDEVVADGETEMEKFILLRNWVRRQWPHNDAGSAHRTWDAIEILSAPMGQRGMCVHYGVTYTQCALALGYQARQVILDGHYVSEIWSNDLQKWVLMDVETTNPEGWSRYGTALYIDTNTGEPMSGLELFHAANSGEVSHIEQQMYMTDERPEDDKSQEPYGEHRMYSRTYEAAGYRSYRHLAYPPRNNYLDQLEPWEEFHGFDHYHSNGYLWFSNKPTNHTVEYSGFTTRAGDIAWTVNTVHARLAATDEPGVITVWLETFTPNVTSMMVRTGGDAWAEVKVEQAGPHAAVRIPWTVPTGTHVLEVKPRTAFDMEGVVTRIEVVRE